MCCIDRIQYDNVTIRYDTLEDSIDRKQQNNVLTGYSKMVYSNSGRHPEFLIGGWG